MANTHVMAFFVIFVSFCTLYVATFAAPWRPGYPVLEEPLLGCPCKVKMGGSVSLPTKIAVRIIPMAQYKISVAEGKPLTTRPGDYTERRKDYCTEEDITEKGDFMMVVYSYRQGLLVRLFSVTRPNEVCKLEGSKNNGKQTKSANKKVAVSARIAHGIVVRDERIAKYNVLFHDREKDTFECSGSLISARWVLTAAHCHEKERNKVIVGKYHDYPGEEHKVEKVIEHEEYSDEIGKGRKYKDIQRELNDIALVRLVTPVRDWQSKAIKINARPELHKKGDPGIVSGYGLTCRQSEVDEILRKAGVIVISHERCRKILKDEGKIATDKGLDREQHICARHDACGRGACRGDSGGPLVEERNGELIQIGITSYHPGKCGERDLPDIYTRVSHYADWIYKKTNGEVRLSF